MNAEVHFEKHTSAPYCAVDDMYKTINSDLSSSSGNNNSERMVFLLNNIFNVVIALLMILL